MELADSDRAGLLSRMANTDVLWVRLRHRIDSEVMDGAPRLRAIATATTGLNHIDLHEARRREIQIISLLGETEFLRNIYATAEHTIALVFGLIRHLPDALEHVKQGEWNRDLFIGSELYGKTAGIVGYGRVGRMVARYLLAFGMRVKVTDPNVGSDSLEHGVELVSMGELLRTADLVTLHVGLTDSTRRFFGKNEFAQMKPTAQFINTSRGELVDEGALLRALRNGRIAGAALDVVTNERSPDMNRRPIVEYARLHDNLLITPHIGGCTTESREKTENFLATRVVAYIRKMQNERDSGGLSASPVEVPESNRIRGRTTHRQLSVAGERTIHA